MKVMNNTKSTKHTKRGDRVAFEVTDTFLEVI